MNYYIIKGRIIINNKPSIENNYLIETDFESIDIYSINIGYTKIPHFEFFIINNKEYNNDELIHHCMGLIPLDSLYINNLK